MLERLDLNQLLLDPLEQTTVILTPNLRLAEQLLHRYAKHQRDVFIKPNILPFSVWLRQVFLDNPLSDKLLLSPHQSDELWLEVVGEQDFVAPLVGELKKAWSHCHQWELPIEESQFCFNQETHQFYQWSQDYQQKLDDYQAIDDAQLCAFVTARLPSLSYRQTMRFIFAHFNEFTPAQQRLIKGLEACQHQCACHEVLQKPNQDTVFFAAKTHQEQHEALIQWIKTCLAQGKTKIGVVVPDLSTQRQALKRLFRQHFNDDEYNFSLGLPLPDYPIVSHALQFLRSNEHKLDNQLLQLLLSSPFLGESESEGPSRWQCLSTLACLQESSTTKSRFLSQIQQDAPKLFARLNATDDIDLSSTLPLDEWVAQFKTLLNALGFPGEQGLDSANYQCFNRLDALFEELINCHLLYPTLTGHEALALLNRLAAKTVFQAQNVSKGVDILGLLEASGLEFDALWVMNMTADCLPQATKLSPFIPYPIQQTLNMPHATNEKELAYAEALLKEFSANTEQCIYSFAEFKDDINVIPCPLIKNLAPYPRPIDSQEPPPHQNPLTELIEPNTLALDDNTKIRGGSFILKDQALCPFKAFAKYRLHATTSVEEDLGLSPLERGVLIHRVLELFWQAVKSQEKLLSLDEHALDALIHHNVRDALKPLEAAKPEQFSPPLKQLEIDRLMSLTKRWLEIEKQRPPFEVIAQEEWQSLTLAGLSLKLRVDRIDKLANGDKWVIDYKTGMPSPNAWFEPRGTEPQLPLYALCDEEITALVFSQLKSQALKNKGVSAIDYEVEGVKPLEKIKDGASSWQNQRAQWQQEMSALAEEFMKGDIRIQPKKSSTCQNCDYHRLCRLSLTPYS